MNNHVPLRVAIHGRRSNIVAAQTIIRPKLFAAKAHVGIARDCAARLVIVFWFALGPANRIPAAAGAKEQNQSCDVAAILVISILRLETHGCLKKQRIFVRLAIRLIPFISGFHYGAGAKPEIETHGPPGFLGIAKSTRIATQMIPAEDQFEIP